MQIAQMGEPEGRSKSFPQLAPVVFRNGQKDFGDFGIELSTSAALNLFAGVGHRQGPAVGSVADHGVQAVGDGKDSGAQRNLFALEAAWITGAVIKFLVS